MEQTTNTLTVEEADMAPEMESTPAPAPAAAPGPEPARDPGVSSAEAQAALEAAEEELRGIFAAVTKYDTETAEARAELADLESELAEHRAGEVLGEEGADSKPFAKRVAAARVAMVEREGTRGAMARRWRHAVMAAKECTATLHRAVAYEAEAALAETHRQIAETEAELETARQRATCLAQRNANAKAALVALAVDGLDEAVALLRGSPSEIRATVADDAHCTVDRDAIETALAKAEAGRPGGAEREYRVLRATEVAVFYFCDSGAIAKVEVLRETAGSGEGYAGQTAPYAFNKKIGETKAALLRQRDAGAV